MNNKFTARHPGPELMDGTAIPEKDLYRNYRELHTINKLLGGYRITLKGISKLAAGRKTLSILDAGCGGGDTLKSIAAWGKRKGIELKLTGVDRSKAAISYATENCKEFPQIKFIHEDIFYHLYVGNSYDIITNCLLLHHFSTLQITKLMLLMKQQAKIGFVINDLMRGEVPYNSIKILTKFFSGSYLVKNDAPLSVLRGFQEADWWHLLSRAYISTARISEEWAYRYLVIYKIPEFHEIKPL